MSSYEAYVVNSFIITDLCVPRFAYLYQEIFRVGMLNISGWSYFVAHYVDDFLTVLL